MKNIFVFLFVVLFSTNVYAAKSSVPTFNGNVPSEVSTDIFRAKPKVVTPVEHMRMQDRLHQKALQYNGDEDRAMKTKRYGKKKKKVNSFSEKPHKPKSATGQYQE